jgi:FkbM family methyltransferase
MKLGDQEFDRLNWFGTKRALAKLLGSRAVNPVVQLVGTALLPAKFAQRLPLSRRRVTYRLAGGEVVHLLDPLHDIIARDIHWGGERPTSIAEQRKLRCIEELSKGAATFLDIGAYGGICALIAARSNPYLVAVAYEIVPENFLLLTRNIIENDVAARVQARLRGIGAAGATVRLPASMNLASNPTSVSLGSAFSEGIAIGVQSLDDETEGLAGPFLVKIDVEGYEEEVFRGARSFIARHRPDIICEILPDAGGASRAIEGMLKPLGYRWFAFKTDGTIDRDHIAPDQVPRDWLFTARGDVDALLPRF